ncbi:MAG: restriction endonuclease [Candidatus Aenigmarchaeota archaeon]|nr:restriction endonuclease [Candidatus Aenigmarchaeota archaeon]
MARRGGSFLESNVERLFKLAGFETETNIKLSDYEIDVYVKYEDKDIIVECKQRDSGGINVRNLIHQWNSKNKEIRASRVIIVITGIDITQEAYELAKRYKIILWDESKLNDLFDKAIELKRGMKKYLIEEMGFKIISKKIEKKPFKRKKKRKKPVKKAKIPLSDNSIFNVKNDSNSEIPRSKDSIFYEDKESKNNKIGIKNRIKSWFKR